MIKLFFITLMFLALMLFLFVYTKKIKIKNIFTDLNLLINYLINNYKKRKSTIINNKNNQNSNKYSKKIKIKYKKLTKLNILTKFKKSIKTKKRTYVERRNFNNSILLLKLTKTIEKTINKNKNFYRCYQNQCLVETIATSFAHSLVIKKNFNIFDNFETLTKNIRIYKKEAEILKTLIIAELLKIYLNLQNDIIKIKQEIQMGERTKNRKIKTNKTPAYYYGLFAFNPRSTFYVYNNKEKLIQATTKLINELDTILINQQRIFNNIFYLEKNLLKLEKSDILFINKNIKSFA